MNYEPPLSLVDVLEELISTGDPGDEIGDVLNSLARSDNEKIETSLRTYAEDGRLSDEQRSHVGEVLVDVWQRRDRLSWDVFDTLSGAARSGALLWLPDDLALNEWQLRLSTVLSQDGYPVQTVEGCLWAIRKLKGQERDDELKRLSTDDRLSPEHQNLVRGFLDYTNRHNRAPAE